jgi:predicted unusual protein kinase regulating ubiquinone biosynthesis (AarF/ABC1/UbiB family)
MKASSPSGNLLLFGLLIRLLQCHTFKVPSTAYYVRASKSVLGAATFLDEDEGSKRLQRARLRLAEAQGIIPIGASENSDVLLKDFKPVPSQSKVREISWRVAEPAVRYDPDGLATRFYAQPVKWIQRNIQFLIPMTLFTVRVITDILTNKELDNRARRANEILDIISAQSPALIKAGQALASRPDLLPKDYLDSLQKLQDRCPPYPTAQALSLFEAELGLQFDDVFELDTETSQPIAAASIGQVYKGILKSNGAKVAIKIQRPACEESIAIDMFIMRWYSSVAQGILAQLGRNIDLVSVIDDFGDLIYREIDYRAEAVNAQRFAELYASIPDVFVPKIYTDLSTSKVLIMEWVDGAKLNDKAAINAMGLDSSQFIDVLVQCSLRQMLENGFFHADPHAGNLLAMPSGKLCYLDFGMVSYVESSQRYSIIEAVVHLVNRDFVSLAELYRRMGFIPMDIDTAPIVLALEDALPDVLNSAVGELNFKTVVAKLGDVMYKFPFSLPPFYIAIIRCLGVLEGLAIQVDDEFKIISDAYPYIASRLLTDPSLELQVHYTHKYIYINTHIYIYIYIYVYI